MKLSSKSLCHDIHIPVRSKRTSFR
jgi:hypothetical protein